MNAVSLQHEAKPSQTFDTNWTTDLVLIKVSVLWTLNYLCDIFSITTSVELQQCEPANRDETPLAAFKSLQQ